MEVLKRSRVNSIIQIWSRSEVNEKWARSNENMNAEIVQIKYAYENYFIVEFVRKPNKEG